MSKDKKSEIHITHNFNAPIGQHIDHVDTINFRMEGDGTFHFGMVESTNKEEADGNDTTDSDRQRIKKCLDTLLKEKVIEKLYDYTWVMELMNQTKELPSFDTPQSFIKYLRGLGVAKLPGASSINKKQNVFTGTFPDWTFTDCDTTEANRRINVAKRFLSLYRNT